MLNTNSQKGLSILYVVFLTTILLAVGLGISGILIGQIKMLGETGYSINAFYAADSGIERVLMNWQNPESFGIVTLSNGATYQVNVVAGGAECPNYCIKSIGDYRGTKRAIEISY